MVMAMTMHNATPNMFLVVGLFSIVLRSDERNLREAAKECSHTKEK